MSNMKVLERKEFRERERTNTQRYRGSVMKTYVHTKALDGYIFTIFLDCYNETHVGYIY